MATQYELPEYANSGFQVPSAVKPAKSTQLQGAFDTQMKGAKDYAKRIKSTSDNIYNTYAQTARNALPSLIEKNREDYNSRGLLNSGKERQAEASTVQGVNQELAAKRSEINQGVYNNLAGIEGNAFNTAGLLAQPGPNTAMTELGGIQTQLAGQNAANMQNAQLIGSALGGGAAIGGAGLASQMQANGQGNPNAYNMGTVNGADYDPYKQKSIYA